MHLDLDRGAFRDRAGSLSREGRHGGGITCQKGSARALMAIEKKREKSGRITVRRGAVARGRGRRALRARRTFAGVEETRLRTDEQDTADMLRGSWSVEWRPNAFAIVKRAEASTTGFATWMPRGIIVHCR